MKILVTGAAGFIGSHTVDLLLERGHHVMVIDNFSTGRLENLRDYGLHIGAVDIRDTKKMDKVFDDFHPEAVLHLAAQSAITTAWTLPEVDLSVNILGTLEVVMMAKVYGVKKFVFSSTSAVYGQGMAVILKETQNCNPDTPYGISKLAAEHYIRLMFPNHVILRYANIYGPRQVPIGENQVIARAFRHLLHGDDFKIVGDGNQERDFVYVRDVCNANLLALTGDQTGTFNVAWGISHSVNEVLAKIETVIGVEHTWEHTSEPDLRGSVYMDGIHIRETLGWEPQISLKQGIALTANYWKDK